MTISQFIEDTRTVSELLLERFGQEKLFLVGHSWGSLLGTLTAARYPDLFHAYVGMGQVASMAENESVCYRFVLETARRCGPTKAVRDLARTGHATGEPGTDRDGGAAFDRIHPFGLRSVDPGHDVLPPQLMGRTDDRRSACPGATAGNSRIYILGRYDMNCPSELAVDYFNRLSAPAKAFFWMENSAHVALMEEHRVRRLTPARTS